MTRAHLVLSIIACALALAVVQTVQPGAKAKASQVLCNILEGGS